MAIVLKLSFESEHPGHKLLEARSGLHILLNDGNRAEFGRHLNSGH